MSAEVHSETELYRVESRSARKLVWIETIDCVATGLWRVFERDFPKAVCRAVVTIELPARSECPRSREFRGATLRLGCSARFRLIPELYALVC